MSSTLECGYSGVSLIILAGTRAIAQACGKGWSRDFIDHAGFPPLVGDRVVNRGHDGAGARQQPLPRISECQGTKPPLDEGAPESMLETGDVSGNAWLREVNPVGGPGESSGIHNLQPRPDPSQFKIHYALPSSTG
jgi:hypothetical protein